MRGRRQAPGAGVEEQTRSVGDTRLRRAPGWLDTPGALRSLDVCLDSKGPFIDAVSALKPSLRPLPVAAARSRRPRESCLRPARADPAVSNGRCSPPPHAGLASTSAQEPRGPQECSLVDHHSTSLLTASRRPRLGSRLALWRRGRRGGPRWLENTSVGTRVPVRRDECGAATSALHPPTARALAPSSGRTL